MSINSIKKPTLSVALIPIVCLIVFLYVAITKLDEDPQIPLVLSTIITVLISIKLGYNWEQIETAIIKTISISMQAILILLSIGILIGIWIPAGVVPTIIYYGLQIIRPNIFLITALIVCSIVSTATGSSWSTAGTVGIALFGIGVGLGIPKPIVIGAIISGAYFGDKMSPLSDTTNLAPAVVGANLFEHIKHLLYSIVPSYIIAAVLFGIIGVRYSTTGIDPQMIDGMLVAIKDNFNINPFLMIPPILVITMAILKVPPVPGVICGGVIGSVFLLIFQSEHYENTYEMISVIISSAQWGFEATTGNEMIDGLFTGGGMQSMMWTVSLVFCAMIFGGVMEQSGCIEVIATSLLKFAKNTGSLVLVTVFSAIFINLVTSDQYLSVVIPGRMYKEEYAKRGLHTKNLSRAIEDGGAMTSPLIPWNTCGAFMEGTFGVSAFQYAPYCFLNLLSPLMSIILGFTGIGIEKINKGDIISATK